MDGHTLFFWFTVAFIAIAIAVIVGAIIAGMADTEDLPGGW
jgi:hypothetical protein